MANRNKKMISAENGGTYSITQIAGLVIDGRETLDQLRAVLPSDVYARVERMVGAERRAGETWCLYGVCLRQTAEAILFRCAATESGNGALAGREMWWPKARVRLSIGEQGPMDALYVPTALWRAKEQEVGHA